LSLLAGAFPRLPLRATPSPDIYTLSLHDALPILRERLARHRPAGHGHARRGAARERAAGPARPRGDERDAGILGLRPTGRDREHRGAAGGGRARGPHRLTWQPAAPCPPALPGWTTLW